MYLQLTGRELQNQRALKHHPTMYQHYKQNIFLMNNNYNFTKTTKINYKYKKTDHLTI